MSKLLREPRVLAYECSRSRCSVEEVSRAVVNLLRNSRSIEDIVPVLEFIASLKALKSTSNAFNSIVNSLTSVKDKVLEYTSPKMLVELYGRDKHLVLKLLVLLELYPKISLRDKLANIVVEVIRQSTRMYMDKPKLLEELLRTLIYGPLEVLDEKHLPLVISVFTDLPKLDCCVHVKSLFLSMIPESYPRRIFRNKQVVESLQGLLRSILVELLDQALSNVEGLDVVYDEVSLFITRLNNVCKDIGDWSPCRLIVDSNMELIGKLAKTILRNRVSVS